MHRRSIAYRRLGTASESEQRAASGAGAGTTSKCAGARGAVGAVGSADIDSAFGAAGVGGAGTAFLRTYSVPVPPFTTVLIGFSSRPNGYGPVTNSKVP